MRDVVDVDVLSDQTLRIERRKYRSFVAGVVTVSRRESFWAGGARRLAREKAIATRSYGDLMRVTGVEDVCNFVPKGIADIERGLRQHDRVASFDRLHDRLYLVRRQSMPDLVVAMLSEYELTGDHLRTARDRYGAFDLALITDPNGRATGPATEVAGRLGIAASDWASFYGRLNMR